MKKVKVSWNFKFPHVIYGNPFSPIAVCVIYKYRYPDRGMEVTEEDLNQYKRHIDLCKRLVSYGAAVAGLQNTELGIVFVTETLLSNPNIRWLIVIGKVGGHRIDLVYRCIKSGHYKGISNYLSRDLFERFRKQIRIIDLIGNDPFEFEKDLKRLIEAAYQEEPTKVTINNESFILYDMGAYEEALHEQSLEYEFLCLDGLFLIKAKNIRHAWLSTINLVNTYGHVVIDHRGKRLTLPYPLLLIVKDPLDWDGLNIASMEEYFNKSFMKLDFTDERYTYGNRIFKWFKVNQFQEALNKMKASRLTQAHITLYDPSHDFYSDEIPCLTEIHLKLNKKEINLRASIRSWDVSRALPFNLYALSKLLKQASEELKVSVGKIIVVSDEPHIYVTY